MFLLCLILLYVVKTAKPVIISQFYVLWHHQSLWKSGLSNTFTTPRTTEIRLHYSWLFHIYTNSLPPSKEFQGVVHKALQTKSSSDRCFMFLCVLLRKATQCWNPIKAVMSLGWNFYKPMCDFVRNFLIMTIGKDNSLSFCPLLFLKIKIG